MIGTNHQASHAVFSIVLLFIPSYVDIVPSAPKILNYFPLSIHSDLKSYDEKQS
jgi:hypothetical protein